MLLHVSRNISVKEKTFVPRVPPFRLTRENKTIKRICMSDSLQNCIGSFPYKSDMASRMFGSKPVYLSVYGIDPSTLNGEDILYPEDIKEFVGDAEERREHWILKEFSAKPYLIRVRKLRLSRFCKYTGEYGGDVTEFEFEHGKESYERVERATFYHRKHFKDFKKVCQESGIVIEEINESQERMMYFGTMPSSRVYTVFRVKYVIPSGVSAESAWNVISKELNKNRRKYLCFKQGDFL